MPLISVILPVYNAATYLHEAVESILHQTFTDFECLAIDDGSTDNSLNILRSFFDPRLKILVNERNFGITRALNRGIEAAAGKFICRMDADDVAMVRRLEKQLSFLEARPHVAVVGSNCTLIDSNGVVLGEAKYPDTHDKIIRSIFIHNPFSHGTVMMRAEVLYSVGGYDPRFLHNEDYDLWLRIAAKHELSNIPEPLLLRRIHDENITVAQEKELVRYRIRTLSNAIFHYYRQPLLSVFLVRPLCAYLYKSILKHVRK